VPENVAEEAPLKAVSAGSGIAYITLAKLWFMVGGWAILFALPHVLPEAVVGRWNVILSWVSVLNNVMVTATIQGVSRFAATGVAMQRQALRLQVVLGGGLALALCLCAPAIASFERDPQLTLGLRVVSIVTFAYSFYAVFVGAANGARAFHKQAGLDAGYTTLRATLVIGGAVVAHSVMGAIAGFTAASVTILLASIVVVGLIPVEKSNRSGTIGELFRFMAPIALFLFITNVIMFVDLWLLKRFVSSAAQASGVSLEEAAEIASARSAVYANGVQAFARIPYQLILSVTFVIFPLVSRSTFSEDKAATRLYVTRAMRYSLLVLGAMAAGLSARPEALLALFGAKYTAGAPALPALAFGYVAFSLFTIASTIVNGAGKTLPTIVIGAVTLAADAGANWLALSWATTHNFDPLVAASIATASAMALGLLLSVIYLQSNFGASLPILSIARTAIAAAAAIAAGRFLPVHGKLGLAACIVGGIVFLVVLFATRELTVGELKTLRKRSA
jgi:stage V sporulation protein B